MDQLEATFFFKFQKNSQVEIYAFLLMEKSMKNLMSTSMCMAEEVAIFMENKGSKCGW